MFLMTAPSWLAALVIVGIPVLLSLLAPVVVRRFVTLDRLKTNNEVAGFKFAAVGVLYAVLLAFVVVVVWERYNAADNEVSKEAAAAAIIYRLSNGLPAEEGAAMRTKLTAYLDTVVTREFPAMAEGKRSPAATVALDALYDQILNYKVGTPRETAMFGEILRQLDNVTQSRRFRLVTSMGTVPGVLWGVLIAGAISTLGFTLFFGTRNLRAQAMMTAMLAVLLFSGLLIVVEFDHPFSGDVRVRPHGMLAILSDFGNLPEPNGR